jgi:hypothetical protein
MRIGSMLPVIMSRSASSHRELLFSPLRRVGSLLHASRTETAGFASSRVQTGRFDELGLLYGGNNHLGDASSAPYFETFGAEIYKNYLYFSPIIGVDGSRRVQDRNPVANCNPRPRPDLTLMSVR